MTKTGLQKFAEFSEKVAVNLDTFIKAIQPAVERIVNVAEKLGPVLKTYLDQAEKVYRELPEWQRASLEVMAKDGWYPDLEAGYTDIFKVAELFQQGQADTARERLSAHFDSRAEEIKLRLSDWFPERTEVLTEAIEAHVDGKYGLSIPVFLAQADGICQQRFGVQLYSKRSGVPRLAKTIEAENYNPLLLSLLYPIITAMPLTASQKERVEAEDVLNRHAILHGEISNYNSRLNSSRALSLLFYVAYICRESAELNSVEADIQSAYNPEVIKQ